MLFHPQPHVPIEASGSMTDLSMHLLWPTLIYCECKKSLNVRFISRHFLFGAFMAKDSWHGVIWQNFLPTILNLTWPIEASGNMTDLSMHPLWPTLIFLLMQKKKKKKKSLNVLFIRRRILFGAFMAKDSWHGVIWQNFLPIKLL